MEIAHRSIRAHSRRNFSSDPSRSTSFFTKYFRTITSPLYRCPWLKKKVGYFNERHLVKKPKYNLSRPLMVVQRSCCRTYIRLWLHVGSIRYDINSVIGIRSNGLHSHGFLLLFCSKKTCVVGCDGTREVPMTQQFFVSELLPNQGLCTVAHSQWFSGS